VLRRHPALAAWAACELLLVLWWLAVYPGLLSPDSVAYTQAVTTHGWSTNGSITYDVLEWLSLQATGSIALLVFAQLTAFAAAMVVLASSLHRFGVRARYAFAAPVVVCATPMVGAFTVYLSKDASFVIGELLVTAGIVRALARDHAARRRVLSVSMLAGALVMTLSRHNGWAMLVIATVLAVLLAPRLWRPMVVATVVATAGWAAVTFSIAPALGAHRASSSLAYGPQYADIGVVYRDAPTLFTSRDLAVMAQVAPLDHWRNGANCATSDALTRAPFDLDAADRLHTELVALWWRTLDRAPNRVIDARICRGAIAWSVTPSGRPTIYPPIETPRNLYGLRSYVPDWAERGVLPDPPWGPLHHAGSFLMRASESTSLEFLLWRGATWCYVAYACAAFAARRLRSRVVLAAAAVVAGNQLAVLLDNPNQLARYMMGCLVVGALLVPLAAVRVASPPPSPPLGEPGHDDELVVGEHATGWPRERK
jgi:hypothetical protein